MKINDKHLADFAMSDSPIDKEGFLHKRGEVNKAYQRRYFVLKGNLLYYFEKKSDKEPIGVIVLEECTVEVAEGNPDGHTFELVFPRVGSRHYVLSADSQDTMESWMRAITCANYEYTKLLVSELQRQLDELNLEQAASQGIPAGPAAVTKNCNTDAINRRLNPFNEPDKMPQSAVTAEPESRRIRSFEELHVQFGKYVIEKIEEMSKIKASKSQGND